MLDSGRTQAESGQQRIREVPPSSVSGAARLHELLNPAASLPNLPSPTTVAPECRLSGRLCACSRNMGPWDPHSGL